MSDEMKQAGGMAESAGESTVSKGPVREAGAPVNHGSQDLPQITRSGGIELPMVPPRRRRDEGRGDEGTGVAGESMAGSAPATGGMGRRAALKILGLAAAAGATGVAGCAPGEEGAAGADGAATISGDLATRESASFEGATTVGNPMARGWPWDPDLVIPSRPWDLVLNEDERAGLTALVDVIIPADDVSPAASEVGAVDFIDEWVSPPMESMQRDLVLVRGGLRWLDRESATRFGDGLRFRDLSMEQKTAICDDICYRPNTAPEHLYGSRFFDKIRDLTATAFYTTEEGMDDIGYVGNIPLPEWGLPPAEVLRHLGLPETGA